MAMIAKALSVNALSVEMDLDRRTVAKLLHGTPPDATEKGAPRWLLATAIRALRDRDQEQHRRPGGIPALRVYVPQIEKLVGEIDSAFVRLSKIKSLDQRRKAAVPIGAEIGRLDRLLASTNATVPEGERLLLQEARDRIVGRAVACFMDLCKWTLDTKAA